MQSVSLIKYLFLSKDGCLEKRHFMSVCTSAFRGGWFTCRMDLADSGCCLVLCNAKAAQFSTALHPRFFMLWVGMDVLSWRSDQDGDTHWEYCLISHLSKLSFSTLIQLT